MIDGGISRPSVPGAGERADRHVLRIAARLQFRQRHLADRRAGRGRRARHRGEDRAADDVGVQQPARAAARATARGRGTCPRTAACGTGSRPSSTNSGSAVSVHDDAEPQIVTAIASPAGRDEKSSMPIHATPASASPIQTPLPSSANSATISSVVISASIASAHSLCSASRRRLRDARAAAHSSTSSSTNAIEQDQRAGGHRELRNPQRRRVVAGRDVVELPRLEREPHAVEREQRGEQRRRRRAPTARARAARPAPRCSRISVTRMCSPRFSVCASARKPQPPCSSRRRRRCRARGS